MVSLRLRDLLLLADLDQIQGMQQLEIKQCLQSATVSIQRFVKLMSEEDFSPKQSLLRMVVMFDLFLLRIGTVC